MKLKSNITLIFGIVTAFLVGCDSFESDLEPQGEDTFDLDATMVALPGTSLFIDLKDKIATSDAVAFDIEKFPSKGVAQISDAAILTYSPNENFVSGSDFFVVKLMNEFGSTLDMDSIIVDMEDSLSNIPCFNGALSDYYVTEANVPVIIEPILNDGYCADQTSGAVINFTTESAHGELEQVDLFVYRYVPDSGFVGSDSLMYELELIDEEDNSYFSLALVTIDVLDENGGGSCDVVYPDYEYLTLPLDSSSYLFQPFTNVSPVCDIWSWELEILSVQNGEAVATQNGLINYFPLASTTSADTALIEYEVSFLDQSFINTLMIMFHESDTVLDCQALLQAYDDDYTFNFDQDSVSALPTEPFILTPLENDFTCVGGLLIEGLMSAPDFGSANVNSDNQTITYNIGELLETTTTNFTYMVCDAQTCDTATVSLTFIR